MKKNSHKNNLFSTIRREYGTRVLSENSVFPDPMEQFQVWFDEIIEDEVEPTAMTLSTVDETGMPDARIVLLKGIEEGNFVFFTHYDSQKGREITHNNKVALNFFWSKHVKQVRVRGHIQKIATELSDNYFASRPRLSQLSALASHQSQVLLNRKTLEEDIEILARTYEKKEIPRPTQWGGYAVLPCEIEFWQGRDNRLHDRIRYKKIQQQNIQTWIIERLSP